MTILRPFLMLASVAFVTGFAGYLAVARVNDLAPPPAAISATISADTPVDPTEAWDSGQRI